MGQLADAKARLAHATTEEEQTRMKLGMSEKELKALEARWKDVEREAGDGQRSLQAKKAEVEGYRTRIAGCGWNEDREKASDMALRNAREELRRLSEVCIYFAALMPH
jgi:structural maintenance of chromosome 2